MQSTEIPKNIVATQLVNVGSNKELTLTTKAGSCCHFVERFLHGKYEIGLRIDWSDMDQNGDPTLDADFFTPGNRKPLREPQFKHVHHTGKTRHEATGLLVYDFNFADLSLQLRLELTREQTITGTARIAPRAPHAMRIRPFIGTLVGIAVGLLAIIVWLLTFEPHGGPELSHYLFPASAILLERMFPTRSIPVPLWYGGALLHWVVPGAFVDLLRRAFQRKSRHDSAV